MQVGRWLSNPVLELIPDTRLVRFPEDVEYRTADGEHHVIPQGTISDGLTAPAWTWGIIGSPLTPRYRRPAALHDVHVVTRMVSKRRSVEMLYETLVEGGTSRVRAWLFTRLVWWFGPKW
jgi:hypothetical protein